MYFAVYFVTLFVLLASQSAHHIFGGDSAEFSLISQVWGIPHPPGYPFYSLISNIIARIIPFYTTTWRISLISSLATIATSYCIYRFLKELKINTSVALISATLYIFLFPIWLYSCVPEVFALNNFFIMLTTYIVFKCKTTKKIHYLFIISFLIGLQISHQHIFILFLPGWLYVLSKSKVRIFLTKQPKKYIVFLFFFILAGVSFYLYAPIVSHFKTVSDWENAKTLEGFFRLFTRAMYGSFKAYTNSSPNFGNQLFNIFSFFLFVFQDFRILGTLFIVSGTFLLKKTNIFLFNFIIISLLLHLLFFFYTNFILSFSFTIGMFERFFISSYLLLIFFFAYGLKWSIAFVSRIIISKSSKQLLLKTGHLFVYTVAIMYVAIVALQNYRTIRQVRTLKIFETYGRNILESAPKNAIIQIGRDNSYFPSAYLYFAEKVRPDLKFIFITLLLKPHYQKQLTERYPSLILTSALNKSHSSMINFLNKNNQNGIYFEEMVATDSWRPYGLLWKYYKNYEEMKNDQNNLLEENKRLWNTVYTIPELNTDLKNILHAVDVQERYITAYLNYSKLLVETNHIIDAENIVRSLYNKYRKNDMVTKTIYMNILVEQKKCSEAKDLINLDSLNEASVAKQLVVSYKNYFTVCDPKNSLRYLLDKK